MSDKFPETRAEALALTPHPERETADLLCRMIAARATYVHGLRRALPGALALRDLLIELGDGAAATQWNQIHGDLAAEIEIEEAANVYNRECLEHRVRTDAKLRALEGVEIAARGVEQAVRAAAAAQLDHGQGSTEYILAVAEIGSAHDRLLRALEVRS